MRSTSLDTYRDIVASGLLGKMQLSVYKYIFANGPLTGRELDEGMAKAGETRTSYHKRLPELQRSNVVDVVGKRVCKVTGRVSMEWDVSGKTASKPSKRKSRADRYKDVIMKMADYMENSHDTSKFTSADIADRLREVVEEIG